MGRENIFSADFKCDAEMFYWVFITRINLSGLFIGDYTPPTERKATF